ncbi:hypothetical protein SAMN05660236_0711 [Ohtaekwangia koreensis]|uniref:Uncharacterized protein n=1 Tax=Ohtaekwangia koreensis TaxID=688867 RepID=A0A1T5J3F8_9BACT|nr:hypothetical protein SAMN05660236_0711 [Ohtaekwangia koreensis]
MYSNFIRITLILLGFSPILFTAWLINVIHNWNFFDIYFHLNSLAATLEGLKEIIKNHYLILVFIIMVIVSRSLIKNATSTLSVGAFDVKQIKPADSNFLTLLFSILLPLFKIPFKGLNDMIFLTGFFIISLIYALIVNDSYHFNLVFRVILGYRNYEVQSKKEVTYLVLSKTILINQNQFTRYVALTNHMLINVT